MYFTSSDIQVMYITPGDIQVMYIAPGDIQVMHIAPGDAQQSYSSEKKLVLIVRCGGAEGKRRASQQGSNPEQISDLVFCHKAEHGHNRFPPSLLLPSKLASGLISVHRVEIKGERERNTTLENLLKPAQLSLDGTLLKGMLFRRDTVNLYSQCSSTLVAKQLNSLN